jgi:hypothetical protein
MAKSFLKRITPDRQRWKLVDWPFPLEDGEDRPKLKVRVLGQNESEEAYLAAIDHFKGRKPEVKDDSAVFLAREHAEMVWRAYSAKPEEMGDGDWAKNGKVGEALDDSVEDLIKSPGNIIGELYTTYVQFYNDVAAAPTNEADFTAFVELLKKNTDLEPLRGFPSSWLIGCISTLASQLAASTPDNSDGS